MPGGHANHKGHSVKPNTNANNSIDTAADLSVEPTQLVNDESGYPFDAQGTPPEADLNPETLQRPEEQAHQTHEDY